MDKLTLILREWYPTNLKGGWGEHTQCPCDKCRDYRITQAHHQIEKLMLTEEEIEEIIKNYFGYKNIAEPVYNMGFGCSLAHALYEAQKEKE